MVKTLNIDGKEVKMRASALIPRIYRFRFGRDMIQDMNSLRKAWKKVTELPEDATEEEKEEAQFSVMDLTIFENVAYVMAKHGDPSTPDSIDEWMDQFELFSIYEVLPEILKLWNLNTAQTSTPKKNKSHDAGA